VGSSSEKSGWRGRNSAKNPQKVIMDDSLVTYGKLGELP
jgi:hypothetical protein